MHVQFSELPVFDQDRAKTFYIDHFDCRIVADRAMGKDGWRWIELKFAGAETTLHFYRRKDETPSAEPILVLVDTEVEATSKKLKSRGVEIVSEPHKAPWQPERTVAEFRDSEGNRIVIGSR